MPTIRLLVAMAGPDQAWSVGDPYVCDEVAAARLVMAGRAEYLVPVQAIETAMDEAAPVTRPRGRPRKVETR